MRITEVFRPLFLASVVASKSLSFFSSDQSVLDDESLTVPGKNPLKFCRAPTDYSLVIQNVDLTPDPPKAGKKLVIEASGNFTEKVEEGAYINLSVKYGLITLIRTTADLCDQMKEVDEECPLDGAKLIKKEVDVPSEVPPGTYKVLADVYTKDDEQVTCLEAEVHFG